MLNKPIKAKFKAIFQSFTSIQIMNAYCWKGQRSYKKEKTSKPHKQEKTKLANN